MVALGLLGLLGPSPGHAAPVHVVLVADGLRNDALDAGMPWASGPQPSPLMPQVHRWLSDGAARHILWCPRTGWPEGWTRLMRGAAGAPGLSAWADVGGMRRWFVGPGPASPGPGWRRWALSVENNAAAALRQRALEETILQLLNRAAADDTATVVLVDLTHLRPPWPIDPELLHALDPRPWAGATPTQQTMERIRASRIRDARAAGEHPSRPPNGPQAAQDRRWRVLAAHAALDAFLGRIDAALRGVDATVVLTATEAFALGEAGTWGDEAGGWPWTSLLIVGGDRPPAAPDTLELSQVGSLLEGRPLPLAPPPARLFLARRTRKTGPEELWALHWTDDWVLERHWRPVPRSRFFDPIDDPQALVPRSLGSTGRADSLLAVAEEAWLGKDVTLRIELSASAPPVVLETTRPLSEISHGETSTRFELRPGTGYQWSAPQGWGELRLESASALAWTLGVGEVEAPRRVLRLSAIDAHFLRACVEASRLETNAPLDRARLRIVVRDGLLVR